MPETIPHNTDDLLRYGAPSREMITFSAYKPGTSVTEVVAAFRDPTDALIYATRMVEHGRNATVRFPSGSQLGARECLKDGTAMWYTRAERKPPPAPSAECFWCNEGDVCSHGKD